MAEASIRRQLNGMSREDIDSTLRNIRRRQDDQKDPIRTLLALDSMINFIESGGQGTVSIQEYRLYRESLYRQIVKVREDLSLRAGCFEAEYQDLVESFQNIRSKKVKRAEDNASEALEMFDSALNQSDDFFSQNKFLNQETIATLFKAYCDFRKMHQQRMYVRSRKIKLVQESLQDEEARLRSAQQTYDYHQRSPRQTTASPGSNHSRSASVPHASMMTKATTIPGASPPSPRETPMSPFQMGRPRSHSTDGGPQSVGSSAQLSPTSTYRFYEEGPSSPPSIASSYTGGQGSPTQSGTGRTAAELRSDLYSAGRGTPPQSNSGSGRSTSTASSQGNNRQPLNVGAGIYLTLPSSRGPYPPPPTK